MNIVKNLVTPDKYSIKCPYNMVAELIVVHNTANDAPAENEVAYMIRNNNQVSFHYAIDDKKIVQGIPEDRNAWHAGDGKNGNGNRTGIAIEICYSKTGGERFANAEKLAAEFIAFKLNERGWGIERVKKHQDFSNKYCPHRTLDLGWERFLNMIRVAMNTKAEERPENKAETNTETVKKVIYYPNYNGNTNSLVDALKSLGIDASYNNRKSIAAVNGFVAYSGTAAENTKMLNLLKSGKLVKEITETTVVKEEKKTEKPVQVIEYYPKYSGNTNSLVDGLKSLKIDASYNNRKKIAAKNGITNYTGTAKQNTDMLNLLKQGKLVK